MSAPVHEPSRAESDGARDRRAWLALAVLAAGTLLLSIDFGVLHLALPALVTDLRPSTTELLWVTDGYAFMIAGFLVPMGALGDRIGRRRLLLCGSAAFAVASALAAVAPSPGWLIAARALMGVAGATIMPSSLALISTLFPDARRRATAIAVFMACFTAGLALGPVLGGALLAWFWWGAVFLLGLPVMALVLLAGPFVLPEHRGGTGDRIDPPSVVLSLIGMVLVVLGLKELAATGPGALAVSATLGGLAVAALFVARQRRVAHPLVDLSLFARPALRVALGAMLVATVVMGGIGLFATQYLQLVAGLSPWRAGLWLVVPAVGVTLGSLLAPAAARRWQPGRTVALGLVVSAAGFGVLTAVDAQTGPGLLVLGYTLAFLGVGPVGVLCTDLVLDAAPSHRAGAASALSETTGELGIGLGVALLGSVGAGMFRAATGGAEITDHTGGRFDAVAAEAFGGALATVAGLCATLTLVAAVVVARRLGAR